MFAPVEDEHCESRDCGCDREEEVGEPPTRSHLLESCEDRHRFLPVATRGSLRLRSA